MPVLFDTTVYVSALRSGFGGGVTGTRWMESEPLWLSAVVLEELYAGAGGRDRSTIEQLESDFARLGRILVPNLADWTQAGQVIAKIAGKYGHEQVGRGRLTNDALIAMSAARRGITVLTRNASDFVKLAEFRPFQWQLHTDL